MQKSTLIKLNLITSFLVLINVNLVFSEINSSNKKHFSENEFSSLKWGMNVASFLLSYQRGNEVINISDENKLTNFETIYKEVGIPYKCINYFQDLEGIIYGCKSIIGFRFGEKGLDHIICSYLFRQKGRRINEDDIINFSEKMLKKMEDNYGLPTYSFDWDGQSFSYIWINKETFIQFAMEINSGWGIQYRSVKYDPIVNILLKKFDSK